MPTESLIAAMQADRENAEAVTDWLSPFCEHGAGCGECAGCAAALYVDPEDDIPY